MLDSLKQKKDFQRIKMRIKTGDLVKVINGKDKGKTGEVLKTIPLENRVVVKGINLRTTRYKAHDPENTCVLGDRVNIRETRPLSDQKRWAREEILNKTSQAKEVKK